MKKMNKFVAFAACITLLLTSCSDEEKPVEIPLGDYDNGVLILNQGNFGTPNSTISYLSNNLVTFQNNIFGLVNPTKVLGDTAQDIGFNGDLAYIVLNNSNTIEIVNRYTMKSVGSIAAGLNNPRYIAFYNGKGYVTNWGDSTVTTDDFVAVLNLTTNTVSQTIPVVEGPERIVSEGNNLYVAHKGGYGFGNSISVINAISNTILTSITVGDVPNFMAETNGILYVMCEGKPSYAPTETGGKLVKINLATNTVVSTTNFAATSHPQNLIIENNVLYYTESNRVFNVNVASSNLPTTPLFTTNPQGAYGIYSFEVKNNLIYVGDAVDYSSNGKVYIYSLNGTLTNEYRVGVSPTGFYFNF